MRSKGDADRTRRADSRALTREASLSYRRRSDRSGPLDDIPEEVEAQEEDTSLLDSDEEVDTPVLDSDKDPQESIGTRDFLHFLGAGGDLQEVIEEVADDT